MGGPVTSNLFGFIFFFFIQIIQTFHILLASAVVQSHMQRRSIDDSGNPGFINIDCGLGGGSYYNQPTGFLYTSDEKYISTGVNFQISTSSSYDNNKPLTTVRSFPEGRKNCYNLWPLKPHNKYLIRTQFMYGNYDGRNIIPEFNVYIGVNFWFTATFTSENIMYKEIIHVATAESIDVCLVNTGLGTPFISSLELRPLDNSSYPASPDFSLNTWIQADVGSFDSTSRCYNVKDDTYDRLWLRSTWPGLKPIYTTNESIDTSQDNPCKVPISVLMTAGEQTNGTLGNLTIPYSVNDPTIQFYIFWHFAELELLRSNTTREFSISLLGNEFGPITPKYLQLTTVASPRVSLNGSTELVYTISKTDKSNLYPILNAVEIYSVLELSVLPTFQEDVDAVTAIKDKYAVLRTWQGDPCLPKNYQRDGLGCTYDENNPPRITSLSLSSSSLTGELPPSLSKLTLLKYLNLSNNGFIGKIPEFLAYLPLLTIIDLTGNNLMGPVPRELAEKASNKSIDLRVERNPDVCKSYPCVGKMDVRNKKHHFIIPMAMGVAPISLLVIIGIVFISFKQRKKQELVDSSIKSKNKQFKSSEIVSITDSFRRVLGQGGFGTVYYGVLHDGIEVAVKVLKNTSSTITWKQFRAEAELLAMIHHVNLVSLIGYCDEPANMALVYEYMSSGDLKMHLSERNEHPLSWKARLQISINAAQGLEYLHSGCRPPIIHRDDKPANILLDEMGHAKIADFGLSRFFTSNSQGDVLSTAVASTRGYLAPEYCQPINTLSEKSDIYAFGIVLLQLLTGQSAFIKHTNHEDDPIHISDWVLPMIESGDILAIVDKRMQGDLNVNSTWKFLEIAMACVKPTGEQRPRMSEVVKNLKLCYALEGFHVQNVAVGVDNGNGYMNSSEALDDSLLSELSAR